MNAKAGTTRTGPGRLFAKLDVDDRTRAVTVAIERGLLPSPTIS